MYWTPPLTEPYQKKKKVKPKPNQVSRFNTNLWLIQGAKEHVKWHHNDVINKIQTMGNFIGPLSAVGKLQDT